MAAARNFPLALLPRISAPVNREERSEADITKSPGGKPSREKSRIDTMMVKNTDLGSNPNPATKQLRDLEHVA